MRAEGLEGIPLFPRFPKTLAPALAASLQGDWDAGLSQDPLDPGFSAGLWPVMRTLGFEYHLAWSACLAVSDGGHGPIRPEGPGLSLTLLAALVLDAAYQGHICLPAKVLAEIWRQHLETAFQSTSTSGRRGSPRTLESLEIPPMHDSEILSGGKLPPGLFALEDPEEEPSADSPPLTRFCAVLWNQDCYLYTRESRQQEHRLLACLRQRLDIRPGARWRVEQDASLSPSQQQALEAQAESPFFLLSGGPGTGKTTVATRMVQGFCTWYAAETQTQAKVILAAPTGRAASRLEEGFQNWIRSPEASPAQGLQSLESMTVDRLVYRLQQGPSLAPDLLVLDEGSMLDLSRMTQVLDLLPKTRDLILIGDQYQLPSVESGAILADILPKTEAPDQVIPWHRELTECKRSTKAIVDQSRTLRDGSLALDSLPAWPTEAAGDGGLSQGALEQTLTIYLTELHGLMLSCPGGERLVSRIPTNPHHWRNHIQRHPREFALAQASICALSPVHAGPWGVRWLNEEIPKALGMGETRLLPQGLPVMLTHNDPELGVFNGDRGLVEEVAGQTWIRLFQGGTLSSRRIPASALRDWEPSFAMTCHKSQGSEFETVILAVPPQAARLASRELLYTGLTRARRKVVIASDPAVWQAALARQTRRHSLIRQRLELRS